MKEKELREWSDQELLEKRKKIKSTYLMNVVISGMIIGIAIYSTVKNGLGFLTFLPIIFALIEGNSRINIKAVEAEIKSRNLK